MIQRCSRCHQFKMMRLLHQSRMKLKKKGVPNDKLPKYTEQTLPNHPNCKGCQKRQHQQKRAKEKWKRKAMRQTDD